MGRRRSDRIVGAGRATQEIVDQAMALARSDRPVLIIGPAGSGKDHLARAIHAWSSRAAQPVRRGFLRRARPRRCSPASSSAAPTARIRSSPRSTTARSRARPAARCSSTRSSLRPTTCASALAKALADGRFQREGDGAGVALRARVIATCVAAPAALAVRRSRRTTSLAAAPARRRAARTCCRWRRTSCGSSPTRPA